MIEFNGNYFYDTEVESIQRYESGVQNYPYGLRVYFKSGRTIGVNYPSKLMRDAESYRLNALCRQESDAIMERIANRLFLVEGAVKRIDKRQLRIWRQLKALLDLKDDEDEEEDGS